MITFWIVAAVLIAVALALLLPPLLNKRTEESDGISRAAANIAILSNQLNELEANLAAGSVPPGQYELVRSELQKRVLNEVSSAAPLRHPQNRRRRMHAILLGLAIPALAVGLYFLLGNPQAWIANTDHSNAHGPTPEQIEYIVSRLEKNPNDPAGWAILARAYGNLGRFNDAAAAYSKLSALVPTDADVLVEWAEILGMAQGRSFEGKPEQLIKRALVLKPDHPKGLALAGNIAYAQKDYTGALKNWRYMMTLVEPGSQLALAIAPGIEKAQSLSALPPSATASITSKPAATAIKAANAKPVLTGKVEIDPALRSQVADSDAVFIFVSSAQGPRVPIVVLRKQVRDLPVEFSFDDTKNLSPDRKLSSVPQVIVGARISKTGDAISQPGDIQALSATLSPNAKNVQLRLTGH